MSFRVRSVLVLAVGIALGLMLSVGTAVRADREAVAEKPHCATY